MANPQQAAAILHDVADRLTNIGIDDILNVRLWRAHLSDLGAAMTVRIEAVSQGDADKIAAEFGLPAEQTRCLSCGSIDHSTSSTYKRKLDSPRNGQFILAADDVTTYVVTEVGSDRAPSLVNY